jgi:hypothetical protein
MPSSSLLMILITLSGMSSLRCRKAILVNLYSCNTQEADAMERRLNKPGLVQGFDKVA